MELFSVNGEYVCKVYKGFNMQKLEEALSNRLSMRKSSFSEQYFETSFDMLGTYGRSIRSTIGRNMAVSLSFYTKENSGQPPASRKLL